MKKKINYKLAYSYTNFLLLCMVIIMIGMACNFFVIRSNSMRMPFYSIYDYETETHFSYTNSSEINYWFLSDIVPIGNRLWSTGDLIMLLGVSMFIVTYVTMYYTKYGIRIKT